MMNLSIPNYSFTQTFLILSVIMILRYFTGCLIFMSLVRKLPLIALRSPSRETKIHDIKWSIGSSLIFALSATILIKLWQSGSTLIYFDWQLYSIIYLPCSLILCLVLHDIYFYWGHRILHGNALKKYHLIHHKSRVPTAWTSFSFHPVEAVKHALFLPLLVLIVPLHISVLITYLTVMSLMGITNHLGKEIYPSWMEKKLFLITAGHHQKHHEDMTKNYGLYFTWWDLLMDTEKKETV